MKQKINPQPSEAISGSQGKTRYVLEDVFWVPLSNCSSMRSTHFVLPERHSAIPVIGPLQSRKPSFTSEGVLIMNSTQRQLIVVTDLCELNGRICPLPAVPNALVSPGCNDQLKFGDQLELRRPDGTVTKVELQGLQWSSSGEEELFIELGPPVTKQDLPPGTTIWMVSGTQKSGTLATIKSSNGLPRHCA